MSAFREYAWPGNIRELENVIEWALILSTGSTLATDRLFSSARPSVSPTASGLLSDVSASTSSTCWSSAVGRSPAQATRPSGWA